MALHASSSLLFLASGLVGAAGAAAQHSTLQHGSSSGWAVPEIPTGSAGSTTDGFTVRGELWSTGLYGSMDTRQPSEGCPHGRPTCNSQDFRDDLSLNSNRLMLTPAQFDPSTHSADYVSLPLVVQYDASQ